MKCPHCNGTGHLGGPLAPIGINIMIARTQADLSQEQLAELAGTNQAIISSIEVGKKDPPFSLVLTIANAFGITLDKLMSGGEEAEAEEAVLSGIKPNGGEQAGEIDDGAAQARASG